jgi:hypothetical protein
LPIILSVVNDDWSREQVEAVVADYLEMLAMELRGDDYNKAERNRQLQAVIGRTRGSIERKHQNISAVMIAEGFPYVSGYKPLGHAQKLLKDVVVERLLLAEDLHQGLTVIVEKTQVDQPMIKDILSIRVASPVREKQEYAVNEEPLNGLSVAKKPLRKNYLEAEMRNRAIGSAGEELAMRYEHERLWRAGKRDLADRIEHVARSRGDGLGYDILSFETTGQEHLIEVKTTNFGALTPFFVSRNEVGVSEMTEVNYSLYRLFNFRRQPRLYVLDGPLRRSCELEPFQYSALPA